MSSAMADDHLGLAFLALGDEPGEATSRNSREPFEPKIAIRVAKAEAGIATLGAAELHGGKPKAAQTIEIAERDRNREKFSTLFRVHGFGVNGLLIRDKGVLWVVWSR